MFRAISKRRDSPFDKIRIEPRVRTLEGLESFDRLEPTLKVGVEALNEVRRSWDSFLSHVAGQEREASLDIRKHTHAPDICSIPVHQFPGAVRKLFSASPFGKERFDLSHEGDVQGISRDSQRRPDGLFVMVVAQLNDAVRVYLPGCLVDVLVVITHDGRKRVQEEFQRLEEGEAGLVVFRNREDIRGNIMRQVINAIENRNLSLVPLHCHVFAISEEDSAESGTIRSGDVCTVWESSKTSDGSTICRASMTSFLISECPKGTAGKMTGKEYDRSPPTI